METPKPSITNCPSTFLERMDGIYFQLRDKCWNCLLVSHEYIKDIQVTIARRFHLFPFRTEKLSLVTPMVLRKWESR